MDAAKNREKEFEPVKLAKRNLCRVFAVLAAQERVKQTLVNNSVEGAVGHLLALQLAHIHHHNYKEEKEGIDREKSST